MPDIDADIKLASVSGDSLAFSRLRKFILSDAMSDRLYDAISVYLDGAPIVDWVIAERFVRYPRDPLIAAATINSAAMRSCPSLQFWRAVESVACGEAWDEGSDARIQAILALHKHPGGCSRGIKEILLRGLGDASPVVRDSSAISAQRCFGIPEPEVISGCGDGNLPGRIGPSIEKWLKTT